MEISQIDFNNPGKATKVTLNDKIFNVPYVETLVHQVVNAFQAGARAGTQKQKNRSEVSGGGKKPWRQKGTGNARAGSTRSPIWRKGGTTFAARPRDYTQKVNKKMRTAAMRSIFSELARNERLLLTDAINIEAPKTKPLNEKLLAHQLKDVLIITEDINENLYYASRNLPYVGLTDVSHVDPVSLIGFKSVLLTTEALKKVEEQLQ